MSLKVKLQSNFESLEKGAMALVFFSVLSGFFLGTSGAEFTEFFKIAGLAFLWFLYFSISEQDFYRAPMGFLLFYVFELLFNLFSWEGGYYLNFAYLAAYLLFAGPVFISAYHELRKNNSFELLTFLLGVFFLLKPLVMFLTGKEFEQIKSFHNFGLAFIIATIIYNDNLWDRFSMNGKNTLKLFFVIALVVILTTSLKSLSI